MAPKKSEIEEMLNPPTEEPTKEGSDEPVEKVEGAAPEPDGADKDSPAEVKVADSGDDDKEGAKASEGDDKKEPEPAKLEGDPEPEPSAKKEGEPEPIPEPKVEDPKDTQIAALLVELEKMAGKVVSGPVPVTQHAQVKADEGEPAKKEGEPAKAAEPEPLPAPVAELTEFATTEELADALQDITKFNALLNKVKEQARTEARAEFTREVPQLVNASVGRVFSINTMVADFYEANEDLKPYKQFISIVANELAAAHQDWDYPTLFKEAGKEARKRLAVVGGSANAEGGDDGNKGVDAKEKDGDPAFAKAPGSRGAASVKATGMKKELGEMLTISDR